MILRCSLLSACALLLVVSVAAAQPILIHDVQGNGAATPIPGATVTVEGVVVGDFQGSTQLSGLLPPGRGRRRRRRSGDLGGHLRLLQHLPDAGRRGPAGAGHRHGVGVLRHDRDHGEHGRLGGRHRRRQPSRRGDTRADRPAGGGRRRRLLRGARRDARHLRRHADGLRVLRARSASARSSCIEGGRPRQFTEDSAPERRRPDGAPRQSRRGGG